MGSESMKSPAEAVYTGGFASFRDTRTYALLGLFAWDTDESR